MIKKFSSCITRIVALILLPMSMGVAGTGQFYFGTEGGQSSLVPESDVQVLETVEKHDSSLGVTLGYDLSDTLSVEGAYYDLGTAKITDTVTRAEVAYRVYGVQGVFSFPGTRSGFSGFMKVGLGTSDLESDASYLKEPNSMGVMGGFGLRYLMKQGFSVTGTYQYFGDEASLASIGLQKRFGGTTRISYAPPIDTDQDGIEDSLDSCPETPAGMKVNTIGCPEPDTRVIVSDDDADGVANELDKCPKTRPGLPVTVTGCVEIRDSDMDGVYDLNDQCAETPAGTKVDIKGCTLSQHFTGILKGVNFHSDSDQLTDEAKVILNGVADDLNTHTTVYVDVIGHTDSTGSEIHNHGLSASRAMAVARYLELKGVSSTRITHSGKGSSEPVSDNNTQEGRAMNRRVELIGTE